MPKRGRPIQLVHKYAEWWPIGKLGELPEMRGIYILYDNRYVPLYCGRAGKGEATVGSRIYTHKGQKYLGRKIRYFSVYDVDRGYMQKMETLLLRALGHILKWNANKGRFQSGAHKV